MKRYQDYSKNPKADDLTEKELKKVRWTRFKIIVPTQTDKKELLEAFEHIHDSGPDNPIDLNFITVNQLAHAYHKEDKVIKVDKELFDTL